MQKRTRFWHVLKRSVCAFALVLSVDLLWPQTPAFAKDDIDPFQLDSGQWMSSAHYNDRDERNRTKQPPPPPPQDQSAPQPPPAAHPDDAAPPQNQGKGFAVQINSTEEERAKPNAPAPDAGNAPPAPLYDKNWALPPAPSEPKAAANKDKDDDDSEADGPQPLNVRMTYLPSKNVAPAPSPEHESAQKLGRAELLKRMKEGKKPPAQPQSPAEAAACNAIDSYKKQQLEAIHSDQQTLKALQEAIHSLGLNKQLDFISGTSGALNAQGGQTPLINTPSAPTNVR